MLLVLEAHDKASGIIGKVGTALDGLTAKVQAAAARANMSAEQLQAVQDRAAAAGTAYERALSEQTKAQAALATSTAELTRVKEEAQAQAVRAEASARAAAAATGEEAAAARAAADEEAAAAVRAAEAVTASSERQVAALDALKTAESEVATRSGEMAAAQDAAAAGSGVGTAALKGVAVAGAAAAVAVGAVGVHAVKTAADFQTGMTKLVTSAGESQSAIKDVSAGVLQLAVETGTSTKELSDGLYMVESAGYHGAAGLTVLKAAAQGARAEGASLQEVGNALTSAMNAYGFKAQDATKVTDMLVAAVGQGKMKMQDLASSLSAVLPIAAAAHISLQQVTGAIATMTAQGMSAQQATQDLSHIIQKLQSPTAESAKYMAQLGLDAQDLSGHLGDRGLTGTLDLVFKAVEQHMGPAGQVVVDAFNQSRAAAQDLQTMLKSMPPNLQQLGQAYLNGSVSVKQMTADMKNMSGPQANLMKQFVSLAGNANGFNSMLKSGNPAALQFSAALKKVFGDSTSLTTALLIGGDHMATFKGNVNAVADAANKAGKNVNGWAEIQNTFNFKLSQLKESAHTAMIAIGSGLLPAVSALAQAVIAVVRPIAEWMAAHQTLSAVILLTIGGLGALVATVLGVVFAVTKVREAVIAVRAAMIALSTAGPIMIALTAIALVAVLIATHWTQTKAILGAVWSWLKTAASDVAGFFVGIWQGVVRLWDAVWAQIGGTVKKWWPLILAPVTGGMSLIVGIIVKYRTQIGHAFEAIWSWLVDLWNSTGGKLISLISQAWQAASASVSKEWTKIKVDLIYIWGELLILWQATGGKLVKLIAEHWQETEKVTSAVWGKIWGGIKQVWGFISSETGSVLGFIADVIKTGWAAVWGVTKTVWNLVWGVIKGVWDLISSLIKAACDFIFGTVIKPAFNAIKLFFEVVWDAIKGIINTALDAIKGILRIFIDVVTGNWSKMWSDIRNFSRTILNDIWSTIQAIFGDIARYVSSVMNSIRSGLLGAWSDIWNGIKGFLSAIWSGIKSAFRAGLDALSNIWNGLKQLAADPVNFVISTVYDNGIRTLWNDVSGLFGGPSAPYVSPVRFASGGLVPGSGTGDTVPALLTPGEFVLSHAMITRMGGPGAIENLFGAGRNDGYHYADGGWSWNPVNDIVHIASEAAAGIKSALSALKDVALGGLRTAAETAFKPIMALLSHIPGGRYGLGKMMVSSVNKFEDGILKFFGEKDKTATAISVPGHVTGTLIQWLTEAIHDTGVSMSWLNGLEVIAMNESGGNPNAINNWDSNAAAGDPSRGLMQTIMSTFMAYHQPGTSTNIYDPVANAAAAINYIKCVPLDSEILTRRGWLKHDQVRAGDYTLGFNPATGRNEWTEIRSIFHGDGEVWRIGGKRWSARVTPNHRWVYHKDNSDRSVFIETRELANARRGRERIRIAAPAATGDGLPLTDDEACILGWILADGNGVSLMRRHVQEDAERAAQSAGRRIRDLRTGRFEVGKGEGPFDVCIFQTKPEGVEGLRQILKDVPHTERIREQKPPGRPRYVFALQKNWAGSLMARSRLLETGPEAFVLALSPSQRTAFLTGFIGADGCVNKRGLSATRGGNRYRTTDGMGGTQITQKNGAVQEAIRLAVYLQGYRPSTVRLTGNRNPAAHIGMVKPVVAPSMFQEPEVLGVEPVWCVETGLGSWTMRQGNEIMLTGNSRYGGINNVPGIRAMAHGGEYVGYEYGTWDTGPRSQLALLHPHEAVLPAGTLPAVLGTGHSVYIDLRGTQVMSNRDIDLLLDKIGRQFTQRVLPQAGVQVRR
ncbi:phage tail tape measure protein [Streptomyces sp. NPDC001404]|uniref:phage tail tape measure protein n=1 Tax=Streptomyces sp. NPDC001404 TaxID=3364571 RepID=UPI0036B06F01